jgi:hypothetical protein
MRTLACACSSVWPAAIDGHAGWPHLDRLALARDDKQSLQRRPAPGEEIVPSMTALVKGFARSTARVTMNVPVAPANLPVPPTIVWVSTIVASGRVPPGVTVEASSPVLIEKTRTAMTDATGQYRIEGLQPGTLQRDVRAHRVLDGEA